MGIVFFSSNGGGKSETTSSGGLAPSVCTKLHIGQDNGTIILKWCDPDDTIINGLVLCTWAKTIIVRKKGAYPESETDGTVVCTNTVRNFYNLTAFVDELPDEENEYFYEAFPVSTAGAVCYNDANRFNNAEVYEFKIIRDADPYSQIEYCGANADFQPAYMDYDKDEFNYGDWKDTFIIDAFKPCMLGQDGEVKYYLNPDNMAEKEDGTASDVTDTSYAGNVMVEIAQIWIKETTDTDGNAHIYIANRKLDENYDCFTHINKNNNLVDYYYYAKYNGYVKSNVNRSISGVSPSTLTSGETQRQYCQANGNGWDSREYSFLPLMWYLHMLIGHSTDSQTVFGTGRYTGGSSSSRNQLKSGLNDTKGMFYGDQNNNTVTTFFIDNFWGNIWELTQGCIQKNGQLYFKLTPNTYDGSSAEDYNSDGEGYINSGVNNGTAKAEGVPIEEMTLVPKIGLVPSKFDNASTSTYYCDGYWQDESKAGFLRSGGGSATSNGFLYGMFAFSVDNAASYSYWSCGASLSYKNPL